LLILLLITGRSSVYYQRLLGSRLVWRGGLDAVGKPVLDVLNLRLDFAYCSLLLLLISKLV